MSSSLEPARRSLATAARALDQFRRISGIEDEAGAPPLTDWRIPAESAARAVLEKAHDRIAALTAELERSNARSAALEADLETARSAAAALEKEAAALRADAAARAGSSAPGDPVQRRSADAAARVSLLEAECVRLEKLRHAADRAAAEAEAQGRAVADALRRELRAVHSSLDRAAVDVGSAEAKARAEADSLRLRLENATERLQAFEREKRLEQARGAGDSAATATELLRAQAVAASLRQEIAGVRSAAERQEDALRRELSAALSSLDEARRALANREVPLPEAALSASPPPPLDAEPAAEEPAFVSPPVEPLLDPGWSKFVRLVRPSVDAAYSHLRRLSATALTAGQKALMRMAAASIAQASDSLSSIELALAEGPSASAVAPVVPVLESSLAAWEAAFRGRGVGLLREFSPPLPESAYDPKELRVALHHVLRNVLEAVPRGGRLTVRASRGPDGGLRVEFADDGPGYPAEWLARRFEPFAAPRRGRAGLGLSLVRRTLRRWGGDAEASNGTSGRGARLSLLFAPPPPPGPTLK